MSSSNDSFSEEFSSNSEDIAFQSDESGINNTLLEEVVDNPHDSDANNQVTNINRMEQYLLSGACGPSDAIKKKPVMMTYYHRTPSISPFEILSDFPMGDF